MNNAEENDQYENADEEESLYVPNWLIEVMESITREEMISRGICTTSRLFHQLCYPKLHGKVEPHRIGHVQISWGLRTRLLPHDMSEIPHAIIRMQKRRTNLLELVSIPRQLVAPPHYITGFERINIWSSFSGINKNGKNYKFVGIFFGFLDEQILEFFMRIIAPLLKNCTIKCEMFMGGWKVDEKRTQQLHQLFMTLMHDGKISMLSFAENRFYYFQRLFPEIIDQVEGLSIEERNIDFEFLLNWLMKKRNNGGQKVLSLGSNGMGTAILDRIKKDFSTSTSTVNFLIWQQRFEHDKFKIENGIGEILELYANSKGQCFLARFPKGEDHWKEVGEKKLWPNNDEEQLTNINVDIDIKSDTPYIDSIWEFVQQEIRKILEHENPYLYLASYEQTYRYVYTMALYNYGQKLYNGLNEIVREHLQMRVRVMLTDYKEQFTENLNNIWNEYTLKMKLWEIGKFRNLSEAAESNLIRDICMYLDRTYVQDKGVMTLQQLGLHIFKTEIVDYPPINQHLKEIFGNLKGKIDDSLFDFLSKHI